MNNEFIKYFESTLSTDVVTLMNYSKEKSQESYERQIKFDGNDELVHNNIKTNLKINTMDNMPDSDNNSQMINKKTKRNDAKVLDKDTMDEIVVTQPVKMKTNKKSNKLTEEDYANSPYGLEKRTELDRSLTRTKNLENELKIIKGSEEQLAKDILVLRSEKDELVTKNQELKDENIKIEANITKMNKSHLEEYNTLNEKYVALLKENKEKNTKDKLNNQKIESQQTMTSNLSNLILSSKTLNENNKNEEDDFTDKLSDFIISKDLPLSIAHFSEEDIKSNKDLGLKGEELKALDKVRTELFPMNN